MNLKQLYHVLLILMAIILFTNCSTTKNTKENRAYHALTTRYNVYYNGQKAYEEGLNAIINNGKDDFSNILSTNLAATKETRQLANTQMTRAIMKAEKAIRIHSITAKPQHKNLTHATTAYKQWLKRKEFNPYLHHAWMLRGKALYLKGDYKEAMKTFLYMTKLYKGVDKITAEAFIRLSLCYTALQQYYDAEEALRRAPKDANTQITHLRYEALVEMLIHEAQWDEALKMIDKLIASTRKTSEKARYYYIKAQLLQKVHNDSAAKEAFNKCEDLAKPSSLLALHAKLQKSGNDTLIVNIAKDTVNVGSISDDGSLFKNYWLSYLETLPDNETKHLEKSIVKYTEAMLPFNEKQDTMFLFLLVYPKDKVDTNKLVFNLAQYNFETYQTRNFNIEKDQRDGMEIVEIYPFENFSHCYDYRKRLYESVAMSRLLSGIQALVISEENFAHIHSSRDVQSYVDFFNLHYSAIDLPHIGGLDLNETEEIFIDEQQKESPTMEQNNDNEVIEGNEVIFED